MSAPPAGPTPRGSRGSTQPGPIRRSSSASTPSRFSTVELNTTGYRIPAEEQFVRWAEQTPPGFRFAPKLAGNRPGLLADFGPRVGALGDRLGPIRVSLISARDEGMIELILGSLDPSLQRRVRPRASVVGRDRTSPRRGGSGARQRSRARRTVSLRPFSRPALRRRGATRMGAAASHRSTCRSTRTSGTRTHRRHPLMRNDYWSCSVSERGTSCRLRRWSPARRSAVARTQRPLSCSGCSRAVPRS